MCWFDLRVSWPFRHLGQAVLARWHSVITGISYFRLSLEEPRLAQANEKRFDVTLKQLIVVKPPQRTRENDRGTNLTSGNWSPDPYGD